jgi:CHASE2 domain-containing sensor protein/DNA replication protein DnaC
MTDSPTPESIAVRNERSLNRLSRAIAQSQGNFALILVRCNYAQLTNPLVQRLKQICPVEIRELHLPTTIKTLYSTIQTSLGEEQPPALMVFGLSEIAAVEAVLTSTNQVRNEFPQQFHFPLVLWMNDESLQKLTQHATDFKNWAAVPIQFEITSDSLLDGVEQTVQLMLANLLQMGAGRFWDSTSLKLPPDALRVNELALALDDLQRDQNPIRPDLQANLHFLIGREADASGDKPLAQQHYEHSLALWQSEIATPNSPSDHQAAYGCLLFHLGLWWRQHATQHRMDYDLACHKAKDYYQQSLMAFQQAQRPDLEEKFINALGEVLTRLACWDELKTVATQAVHLHQAADMPIRLAYGYGLLAEVALHTQNWMEAKGYAELALQTNEVESESTIDWSWDRVHYRNYYWLLLAEAYQGLTQVAEAISNLETARSNSQPEHDPLLYIRILANLRSLKFAQHQYLEAFEIKQEQHVIEQQYGLRAFVGAGRLRERRQVLNQALALANLPAVDVNQEIAASGRMQDINRLVERMGRTDHKLTVIYGQSGVGKSSLLQAGLLPALKQMAIEARDVMPVLLQVYNDWFKNLGVCFAQSYEEIRGLDLPLLQDSMGVFLAELRKTAERNLLTVLIFDQFEEFFFAHKDAHQRRPFFDFLRDCLNIPYVKVVLSLREDYLHYLLECTRLTDLKSIDNNILDKNILYYLGNFSPEDARSVITTLTQNSQLYLEPDLLDALVADLAGNLGEVRPIELQVVGAQLQADKIFTLAQYQEHGPKDALVGRFLQEVVQDCGKGNENFAQAILYLLTDDNNTRPLKPRAELEEDLALTPEQLDLILKILVKSGLALQIPGSVTECYQLIHDYFVPFIRQQHFSELAIQLEKEKKQREHTENELSRIKLAQQSLNQILEDSRTERSKRPKRKGFLTALICSTLVTASSIALEKIGFWQPFEQTAYSMLHQARGSITWDERIALIEIDNKTLKKLCSSPCPLSRIPRRYLASLLEVLSNAEDSVVAFDILMPESNPDDAILAEKMHKQGFVLLASSWDRKTGGSLLPAQDLRSSAFKVGHTRVLTGSDNFPHGVDLQMGEPKPTSALGFAAIQTYKRLVNLQLTIANPEQRLWINWAGPVSEIRQTYSLIDILENKNFNIQGLSKKIILVGYTADGVEPISTPFDRAASGVHAHVAIIDNLLKGNALRRLDDWAILILLFVGLGLSLSIFHLNSDRQLVFLTGFFIGWILICLIFFRFNYWIPVVAPATTIFAILISRILLYQFFEWNSRYLDEITDQRLKSSFEKYLSLDAADFILKYGDKKGGNHNHEE